MFYVSKFDIVTLMYSDSVRDEITPIGTVFRIRSIGTMGFVLSPIEKPKGDVIHTYEYTPAMLDAGFTRLDYIPRLDNESFSKMD